MTQTGYQATSTRSNWAPNRRRASTLRWESAAGMGVSCANSMNQQYAIAAPPATSGEIGGRMKITIVYESMFGNTHEVAKAISEGAREAYADADVECVPVAEASPELIKGTDLLVVGGPTHMRGMTSGFSRKIGVSGEESSRHKVSRLMR